MFQKNYDNPKYYVSLMIFQTYKNIVLMNVHSLGWHFWLCFYPNVDIKQGAQIKQEIACDKCKHKIK
jgi:hypothetical protein